ncbi:hypothetical protein CPSG_09355 [Coccidioides posadasii str. Silveira]|uniref:Uncharacterized protein n=1 Tax=Coccidioides posadasii (strain RMSCC 757 / Silveira) TaxID=443226 RepID=E9DHQ6_COCPS|nr:hypothetical protein CPSG_09355 [Coccidioides posadasii str. Silveira]
MRCCRSWVRRILSGLRRSSFFYGKARILGKNSSSVEPIARTLPSGMASSSQDDKIERVDRWCPYKQEGRNFSPSLC